MPVVQPAQQRRAQRLAVVGGPLVDHQPPTRVQLLLAVLQEVPRQVPHPRPMVGVQVDEKQVGLFRRGQKLQGIADAYIQPRVIVQAQVLHGQARYLRAQFDGLDVVQRKELHAGLGQRAGPQAEKQRALRLLVAQRPHQHGAGIVVFQPAWVGREHAALLDRIAEFQKAVVVDFIHADDTKGVLHPCQ